MHPTVFHPSLVHAGLGVKIENIDLSGMSTRKRIYRATNDGTRTRSGQLS